MTPMNIHPIAEEVIRMRTAQLPDGRVVAAHSFVTRETCDVLYDAVRRSGASRGVEIGMAFGISTICIADALRANTADAHLVSFDPTQRRADSWNGAGLWQVERAGLRDAVELREETSQAGLPRLVESGYRCAFAFIDGWHTFDHTLLDFFHVDLLLDVGGYVVFDDVDYPAVEAVVRFVVANRHYALDQIVQRAPDHPAAIQRVKVAAKSVARRLGRTHRDPAPEHEVSFRKIAGAKTVGLRKTAEDDRPFDHFRAF
jgi:predicted O-methyltransferase YrrM